MLLSRGRTGNAFACSTICRDFAVVGSRTQGYRRRAEDHFYLERATGWRDLLASWAGSFHVFSTLPLSFDLIALGVEVVE
jgi:hypothetical protein